MLGRFSEMTRDPWPRRSVLSTGLPEHPVQHKNAKVRHRKSSRERILWVSNSISQAQVLALRGALVSLGKLRCNDADHEDWEGRYLHKTCWKVLKREKIMTQILVSTSYSSHPGSSVRTVTGPPPSMWLLGRRKRESREKWWICVNKGALQTMTGNTCVPFRCRVFVERSRYDSPCTFLNTHTLHGKILCTLLWDFHPHLPLNASWSGTTILWKTKMWRGQVLWSV
jgi:hypothetical protein